MIKKEWSSLQYIGAFIAYSILYWGVTILYIKDIIKLVFRILKILSIDDLVDDLFEASGSAEADLFFLIVVFLFIMLLVYPFLFIALCQIIKLIAKRKRKIL